MTNRLDDEIRELEQQFETLKASKPAHDTMGLHEQRLLELEDELDEKRREKKEGEGDHTQAE